jgi:hypothetical protein
MTKKILKLPKNMEILPTKSGLDDKQRYLHLPKWMASKEKVGIACDKW